MEYDNFEDNIPSVEDRLQWAEQELAAKDKRIAALKKAGDAMAKYMKSLCRYTSSTAPCVVCGNHVGHDENDGECICVACYIKTKWDKAKGEGE